MFGKPKPQVLVVGAGPVGMFAALSLAREGVRVQIVDEQWRPAAHSYALVLHSRSLELLDRVGILGKVLDRAYRVRRIGLYEHEDRRAEVRLSDLGEDFSFLAIMRQDVLEQLLEDELGRVGVKVQWNHRVSQVRSDADGAVVTIDKLEKESVGYAVAHTEWGIAKRTELHVPFVIGADGHRSLIRRSLDIHFGQVGQAQQFAVFEFETDADLRHEMRLVMDERTTNVLWPLPDGRCRWSFQLVDEPVPDATRLKSRLAVHLGAARFPVLSEDRLRTLLDERAPWFKGSIGEINWRIVVRFERRLADAFGRQRLWLAGDAGHMSGPVGGHSMNVGLREAHELTGIMTAVLSKGEPMQRLADYERQRLAEWRFLLGLEGGLVPGDDTHPWIRQRAQRLLPCIPASRDDLTALARQLSLETHLTHDPAVCPP